MGQAALDRGDQPEYDEEGQLVTRGVFCGARNCSATTNAGLVHNLVRFGLIENPEVEDAFSRFLQW